MEGMWFMLTNVFPFREFVFKYFFIMKVYVFWILNNRTILYKTLSIPSYLFATGAERLQLSSSLYNDKEKPLE